MPTEYDVYLGRATDEFLTGFMIHQGVKRGLSRYLVNSYAQKVGAGDRQYQDNASFDYWTTKDWSSGFGHKDPEEGLLYGHADTRFPHQALLPLEPLVPGYIDTPHGGTDYRTGEITLTPLPTDPALVGQAASTFYNISTQESQVSGATVKIKAPLGSVVTISIYTLSAGRYPETKLSEATATVITDRPVAEYVSVDLPQVALAAGTEYAIVVSCSEEAELYHTEPYRPQGWGATLGRVFYPALSEGQWGEYPYAFQFAINQKENQTYLALQNEDVLNISGWDDAHDPIPYDPGTGIDGDYFATNEFGQTVIEFAKALGLIHVAWGSFLDQWNEGTGDWEQVYDSGGPAITDIIELDNKIWVGLGAAGYAIFDPSDNSVTVDAAAPVSLWHLHKGLGLLYRSFENDVWYTNDAITWTGPYEVCRHPYEIRGMASMGEYVYFGCDDKLYYLGPGDFVHQLAKWPSIDSRNGLGMVEWTGNLYIPLAEDIVQYAETGVMLQMGLRVGEGLPPDLQGNVYQLLATNYFLLAIVDPSPALGAASVWAYNQQGWHNICRLPQGIGAGAMYLDTVTNWLWIGSGRGIAFRATYPPSVINPIRDFSSLTFCREGWIEFDEFDGRLLELIKDGEAIYINGEFIGEACCLGLYWQEEGDTDWQFLGRVTEDHIFTRWRDYTVRPKFRTIRLGISFRTDDEHVSPIVRAHMLKYLAITTDRHGWQARLLVSDFDEDLAGQVADTEDTRQTKNELLDELENEEHPIIWQYIDGKQYEVRITAANMDAERYEQTAHDGRKYDSVRIMTIEQVTFDPFMPQIPTR